MGLPRLVGPTICPGSLLRAGAGMGCRGGLLPRFGAAVDMLLSFISLAWQFGQRVFKSNNLEFVPDLYFGVSMDKITFVAPQLHFSNIVYGFTYSVIGVKHHPPLPLLSKPQPPPPPPSQSSITPFFGTCSTIETTHNFPHPTPQPIAHTHNAYATSTLIPTPTYMPCLTRSPDAPLPPLI